MRQGREEGDRKVTGNYVNRRLATMLGWIFFGIICVAAIGAPILLVLTGTGAY
jgi:hypothetical protein